MGGPDPYAGQYPPLMIGNTAFAPYPIAVNDFDIRPLVATCELLPYVKLLFRINQ
jgi:hypothetical protein